VNKETITALCAINTQFYQHNSASFSQTRNAPWQGWQRCMQACGLHVLEQPELPTLSVLDIACGNLRFENFLLSEYPATNWQLHALDNCAPLVESGEAALLEKVTFTCEDAITTLIDSGEVLSAKSAHISAAPFNIVASFGFMHHIPSFALRKQFIESALSLVAPGGYVVLSFWQFLNNAAKHEKVEQTHAEALEYFAAHGFAPTSLEEGDYFLGWKNTPGQYRYCHHFSNKEIDLLVAGLEGKAKVVSSFSADGKTGNLNRYIVLQKA
jgi:SAM-dependent methyltransferase